MQYPAKFAPDPSGGYVITFRDIPEAITQGDTEEEAVSMAHDALFTALEFYFEDQRRVPPPSLAEPGERLIALPPALANEISKLNETVTQQTSQLMQPK